MLTAPSGPITAISAVGQAKLASVRMCFAGHDAIGAAVGFAGDDGDFRDGGFGKGEQEFRAVAMMPPYSCCVPGRNPGTSSKVISGMLKASQKRTKRAPFTEALISSMPARNAG